MIPAEAVEAAWDKLHENPIRPIGIDYAELEAALEAAAPQIAGAWHDAVSEAYVEGALSLEQASVMWNKNPYRTPDAR